MLVSDVINDAKYSELQQLSLKDDDNAILTYINMGVLELYKRFNLRTEEAIVSLSEGKTIYTLDPTLPDVDMDDTYELLYILSTYDEGGNQISLNDEEDPLTVMTPAYNTIQLPNTTEGTVVSVIYSAAPKRLTLPEDSLPIPPTLYEALLHYIGHRAHASIDATANTENNMHYLRFEKSCDTAKQYGLVTADDVRKRYVEDKGFI